MVQFALKGAAVAYPQLEHRAQVLSDAGLPVRLELHTFGKQDLYSAGGRATCLENLRRLEDAFGPADLTVHIPFQDVEIVTSSDFDAGQVSLTLAFAKECGASRIVMHRYWGMVYGPAPARSNRAEAAAGFNATVAELAREAPDILLLVENMGHYFLASRRSGDYLAGPIDHFFPWEVSDFRKFLASQNIANVFPFIDVAHATLSSNLFNYARSNVNAVRDDPRFSGITADDLEQAEQLHPFDFVDAAMPWLHLSDSIFFDEPASRGDLPRDALTTEGLEIGTGTLPFSKLPERISGGQVNTVLCVEVEPASGETYVGNGAQQRSLDRLRTMFSR
ncbi:hypothetical protein C7450_104235 [Chelatococcus asaccharovorans]|uniref:Sugar phosphate isomerase/epimerase n=2 Tax=Chelatococcus asaccharovorans TaxID=28210 RepID=A0A2V3U9N0_9HYPH|nr:hypothetical protein C7450_104235 [Chelatococcus asaccharovorans]